MISVFMIKINIFICLCGMFGLMLFPIEVLPATLNVPTQYPTVQSALNSAQPGDLVLISPGVYNESVVTVRSGTSQQRIVVDGQGGATLRQFTFRHSYITVQNVIFTGITQMYSRLVYFDHNGHYGILSNCILDAARAPKVYGIEWRAPITKPFGQGEVASNCLIINNIIRNVIGITMASIMGDFNRVVNNYIHDGGAVDFFRLFGRNNYIGYNTCYNNYIVEGIGNHPDFIQTFGTNGDGSQGHVIEGNLVMKIDGGQLTQLEGNLVPEIRDWTFRNNLFIDVALQASCTIPEVKYYNNLFYRCNKVNGGHALTFGCRFYDGTSSGGKIGYNCSNGSKVYNNIFLDNGSDLTDRGWYSFETNLTGVEADYNYVAKANYVPVTEDPNKKLIGDAGGWDNFKWWELHGINGGNPKFIGIFPDCYSNRCNFRLQSDSILINTGVDLSSVWAIAKDYDGVARPQGTRWDIGPFEYSGIVLPPPSAPFKLQIQP